MAANRTKVAFTIASRIFVCCMAVVTIAWGCYVMPIVWSQSGAAQIAGYIISGDPFQAKVLTSLTPRLDIIQSEKWDHPSAVRNSAVIRLRIFENEISDGDQKSIDIQLTKLRETVAKSLANAPADPFLWVVLFWLENTQNGYNTEHLKYLRMSYALGPEEGWVAVRRSRIALAIFPQLPPDIAEYAKSEFVRLVDSRMYYEAADILVGPGWVIRSTLLAGLKDATELNRKLFDNTVYRMGYDVSVPGVEQREKRPWD